MPKKKRKQEQVEPAPEAGGPSAYPYVGPVTAKVLVDPEGGHWRLARGPLAPRRAKRLAVSAHAVCEGEHDYDEDRDRWYHLLVPEADRPTVWRQAAARYGTDHPPSYEAYEFTDDDGRVLLYIETFC